MVTDLVRFPAFQTWLDTVPIPEGIGSAVFGQNVVLAVVNTGAAALFFHDNIASFAHNRSPQLNFNLFQVKRQ